jgi:hypothetical protein
MENVAKLYVVTNFLSSALREMKENKKCRRNKKNKERKGENDRNTAITF